MEIEQKLAYRRRVRDRFYMKKGLRKHHKDDTIWLKEYEELKTWLASFAKDPLSGEWIPAGYEDMWLKREERE